MLTAYKDGLKWQVACPFDELHRAPDAVVYLLASGALAFRCSHNSCAGRDWQQSGALVEERRGAKFQFSNNKSATERASKWDSWLDNLPAVLEAENVLIVKSDKDVETAREKYALVATCNPMDVGKWRDEYSQLGFSRASLLEILHKAPAWKPAMETASERDRGNPWSRAERMGVFLKGEEEPPDFLHLPVIRGTKCC